MKFHLSFLRIVLVCSSFISLQAVTMAQTSLPVNKQHASSEPNGIFISTGDNNYLGQSLPVDSRAAIEASFDLFKALGAGRVYWRGLETAAWMETNVIRPESGRYYEFWKWSRQLYDLRLDSIAVEIAHKKGLEIWGVGNLADWASQADAPPFNDYPYNSESSLRIDSPQWVPVDRYGVLRQGGAIDFSYPGARKAIVDLHIKIMDRDRYDGVMFFSYSENHSVRYQDEFGFNEPVVTEFKRRYGIDIRTQPFTRSASRADWVRLRGEYLTAFLREMKQEMKKKNQKLTAVLDPHDIHSTQPWNIPEIMQTGGPVYQDIERWVREGIVDQFVIFGSCSGTLQSKALDNTLWLTRGTPVTVAAFTSSPPDAGKWKSYREQGVTILNSFNEEEMFLDRSSIPPQPVTALKSDQEILRMRILAQIIYGQASASVADLAPLANDRNLLIRRMALKALGMTKDAAAIPIIEKGLEDPENAVRSIAALALGLNHGPQSLSKILGAMEKYGNHSFNEVALTAVQKFTISAVKPVLMAAYRNSKNAMVRTLAIRVLDRYATEEDIPTLVLALDDVDQFARFCAAQALGNIRKSPQAAEVLIKATLHDDPVVSDRAATSLATIMARKEPVINPLHSQILDALRILYGKLGEGCRRPDASWGYRPVGNALLAMGTDGEAVLKNFMNQARDKRLAESAWKSLYIRQRPNSFSEVTAQEDAEAFRMRPAFLQESAGRK